MSERTRTLKPTSVGEVLKEEYIPAIGSEDEFIRRLNCIDTVEETKFRNLLKDESALDVVMASKLAKLFGSSIAYWLSLQSNYLDFIVATDDWKSSYAGIITVENE